MKKKHYKKLLLFKKFSFFLGLGRHKKLFLLIGYRFSGNQGRFTYFTNSAVILEYKKMFCYLELGLESAPNAVQRYGPQKKLDKQCPHLKLICAKLRPCKRRNQRYPIAIPLRYPFVQTNGPRPQIAPFSPFTFPSLFFSSSLPLLFLFFSFSFSFPFLFLSFFLPLHRFVAQSSSGIQNHGYHQQ